MEQLTIKEALAEGYEYCAFNQQDWGSVIDIKDLNSADFEDERGYLVCCKEPTNYAIAESLIEDQITEHIDCQDEFNDEDGELSAVALEGCDDLIKQLTDKINDNLKAKNFWFQTEIKLVP